MQLSHGEITYRKIPEPRAHPALARFRCGLGGRARAVNKLVRRQYRGKAIHHPAVLAMQHTDTKANRTIGLAAWRPRRIPAIAERPGAQIYIHLIGISRRYRGHTLPDGTPLGQALLGATLQRITHEHGGETPLIWALVAPRNERSNRMFASNEFTLIAPAREARSRHLPPWFLPRRSFPGDALQVRWPAPAEA
jgi:hypothetical protein